MPKKLLPLFLLFLSAGGVTAQFSKIYYPDINRAEMAITQGLYSEASAAYREAFSNVKHPLALDLYNATVCRILSNDFEGAKPYLLKLATKGIPVETLEKEDVFQKVYSRWETFKPVYRQIQSTFEKALPDSVKTWAAQWNDTYTETPKKILQVRGASKGTTFFQLNPLEDVSARMKLEKHLSATDGYGEEEDGLLPGDYLLTPLNAMLFSRYLGPVLLHQKDSVLLKSVEKLLNYTPQINGVSYLLQGIEAGRWHRTLHNRLLNRGQYFSIARVRTEEDCGDEFSGYYIRGQASAGPHPFAEETELIFSKLRFHFSRETHDFKLGTENTSVNLKDFPSCKTAREEMQHWTKLSR